MQTHFTIAIRLTPPEGTIPIGWLAAAELAFDSGPLEGLSLVGFVIKEAHNAEGAEVTFPARSYTQGGKPRQYQLLRATDPAKNRDAAAPLAREILTAYREAIARSNPEDAPSG